MQKTLITLVDDLDGTEAHETVEFSLDGTGYQIDLSPANADRLRHVFADYVQHARRTGGRRKRPTRARTTNAPNGNLSRGRTDAAEIRRWAHDQGIDLALRGRIPEHVRRRYEARHQPKKTRKTAQTARTKS